MSNGTRGRLPPVGEQDKGEAFAYLRTYHEQRDYAVRLARHYIRVVMEGKGQYHPDNGAEMECFVDAIIEATCARVYRALEEHRPEVDLTEALAELGLIVKKETGGSDG